MRTAAVRLIWRKTGLRFVKISFLSYEVRLTWIVFFQTTSILTQSSWKRNLTTSTTIFPCSKHHPTQPHSQDQHSPTPPRHRPLRSPACRCCTNAEIGLLQASVRILWHPGFPTGYPSLPDRTVCAARILSILKQRSGKVCQRLERLWIDG